MSKHTNPDIPASNTSETVNQNKQPKIELKTARWFCRGFGALILTGAIIGGVGSLVSAGDEHDKVVGAHATAQTLQYLGHPGSEAWISYADSQQNASNGEIADASFFVFAGLVGGGLVALSLMGSTAPAGRRSEVEAPQVVTPQPAQSEV